jgi:hypothetical protein
LRFAGVVEGHSFGMCQPLVGGLLTRAAVGGLPLLENGLRLGIFQPSSAAEATSGKAAPIRPVFCKGFSQIKAPAPRAIAALRH